MPTFSNTFPHAPPILTPMNWADIEDSRSVNSTSKLSEAHSQGMLSIRTASQWDDDYIDMARRLAPSGQGRHHSEPLNTGAAASILPSVSGETASPKAMLWNATNDRFNVNHTEPPPMTLLPRGVEPYEGTTPSSSSTGPPPPPMSQQPYVPQQRWEGHGPGPPPVPPMSPSMLMQWPGAKVPSAHQQPHSQTVTSLPQVVESEWTPSSGPQLLWCEAVTAELDELPGFLNGTGVRLGEEPLHFDAPTKFSRWLFEQPRGNIMPSAVLVSGWRETKPCAMAIRAARSGEVGQLRPDARRPDLRQLSGSEGFEVQVAVHTMIITLRTPDQRDRILSWVEQEGNPMTNMKIEVACDAESLRQLVAAAFRRMQLPVRSPPPLLSPPPFGSAQAMAMTIASPLRVGTPLRGTPAEAGAQLLTGVTSSHQLYLEELARREVKSANVISL
mmetsp:Transcript_44647/g.143024  ORF Transcript_44647/g.143024 Transcript_44647/m.143024 type:complete len:444 (+) Transcript_44647:111-1442(+)